MDSIEWDEDKSLLLKRTRGFAFDEVVDLLKSENYVLLQKNDDPEQWMAIGFAKNKMISLIYEERTYKEQNIIRLITYWLSTKREKEIYEKKIRHH